MGFILGPLELHAGVSYKKKRTKVVFTVAFMNFSDDYQLYFTPLLHLLLTGGGKMPTCGKIKWILAASLPEKKWSMLSKTSA